MMFASLKSSLVLRGLLHAIATTAVVVLAAVSTNAQTPSADGLPVILVHGFCGSSGIWSGDDGLILNLQSPSGSPRFGLGVTHFYARKENVAGAPFLPIAIQADTGKLETQLDPNNAGAYRLFTIDFVNESFPDSLMGQDIYVNDTGIAHKAAELATVIKAVTRLSGKSKVILVGHSLGGLAARAYVQGRASWDGVNFIPYATDVAQIIMFDTPNQGTPWGNVSQEAWFINLPECITEPSRDKEELAPYNPEQESDNPFLWHLNTGAAIPDRVRTSAIVSWSTRSDKGRGDGIVGAVSQNLKLIPPYNQPGYEYVVNYDNPVRIRATEFKATFEFHTSVYRRPETVALIRTLLLGYDATSDLAAPLTTLNRTLTYSGSALTVTLSGSRFTPGGIVRVFHRGPGDIHWSTNDVPEIRANMRGNVQFYWDVSCTETPGLWSWIARDETAWLKGDFNGDAIVNSVDWSMMNMNWFTSDAFVDLNSDGLVNSVDFSVLSAHWLQLGARGRVTPTRSFNLNPPPCS